MAWRHLLWEQTRWLIFSLVITDATLTATLTATGAFAGGNENIQSSCRIFWAGFPIKIQLPAIRSYWIENIVFVVYLFVC